MKKIEIGALAILLATATVAPAWGETSDDTLEIQASQASTQTKTDDGVKPTSSEEHRGNTAQLAKKLRIASWGGAYGEAQERAILAPIGSQLGIKIERTETPARSPAAASADVVEVDQASLARGCQSGDFVRLAPIDLIGSPDNQNATEDFVNGASSPCGVATFAWSALILFDQSRFTKRTPRSLADAFNIKRFPGKRAFPKRVENLIELLAMATGVAPDDVYPALLDEKQSDGLFLRLEALLPHIVWVEDSAEALSKLESNEVRFALSYSGRAFRKTIAGGLSALWSGHVYDHGSWAISSKAADKDIAKSFIALATSPKLLAAQARLWPYGPMRHSAVAMVGRHALLDVELAPFMPTSDQRLRTGLRRDAAFWSKHGLELQDRLNALLEGFPKGVRVSPPVRRPEPPPPPPPVDN